MTTEIQDRIKNVSIGLAELLPIESLIDRLSDLKFQYTDNYSPAISIEMQVYATAILNKLNT